MTPRSSFCYNSHLIMAIERGALNDVQPYPLNADGSRPKWFNEDGVWDPYKFDASEPYTPKGSVYTLKSNPERILESPFDLRNLRVLDPNVVIDALESIENQAGNGKDSIIYIGTGGTLSMMEQEGTKRPVLNVDRILEYSGRGLRTEFNYSSFSFPTLIDSSQFETDYDADLVIAMTYVWSRMTQKTRREFLGFSILHGTDTMQPSPTRLQMMLGSNLDFSVGVVGAQANIEEDYNEIPDNISRCVATLKRLRSIDRKSVFIYMGGSAGGAYNPSGAEKISDVEIKGFASQAIPEIVNAASIRLFHETSVSFANTYRETRNSLLDTFQPTIVRGFVNSRIIEARMGIPPQRLIRDIQNDSENLAIILRTYGAYTFHRQQADAIMETASSKNLPVFVANPFPTGETSHTYADAKYLLERGGIPLHMMPHAAEVKLTIASAVFGSDRARIEAFMTSNDFVGEQPPSWIPRSTNVNMRVIGQPIETHPEEELQVIP